MAERVTFVMPAYNVGKYIEEAVESLQAQTCGEWRLVIVNDGSQDETRDKAESLASQDRRIKVLNMANGSGSAYQPRKRAILESETEWVAPLDADDWVNPEYLEQLLGRQQETGADIVYPTMWEPGNDGKAAAIITPKDESITGAVWTGKDCVKHTLDGWRINCNGGLIRKKLYEEAFERFDSTLTYSCADELLGRQLLTITPKVAFSEARYYYRPNEESITRKRTSKLFDILINTQALIPFVKEIYGDRSEEYILAHRQNFHAYFDALRLLNRWELTPQDRRLAEERIMKSREAVDTHLLKGRVSPRYMALFRVPPIIAGRILKTADKYGYT